MPTPRKWGGDLPFLLENLILKDFRIRYRNMSLGILWSLINPLVMMGVLTFVFGHVLEGNKNIPAYPLFILCGLIPFNFFTGAVLSGTTCIVENAGLVKRVTVPREVVPVASVLSNCVHLGIQFGLVVVLALFHLPPTQAWLWLPVVWVLYMIFVCGLALGASAINVFIRDTRYLVESFNLVLFWLVPIFYTFPDKYVDVYRFNPVAALVMAMRNILIDHHAPAATLVRNMAIAAVVTLALGTWIFERLKAHFYEHI